MSRQPLPDPTEAEFAILQIVWELGQPTYREVFEARRTNQDLSPTTVSTLITRMLAKGLLRKVPGQNPQRVEATADQLQTQDSLILSLADRLVGGSVPKMLIAMLRQLQTTPDHRAKLEKLLREAEADQ